MTNDSSQSQNKPRNSPQVRTTTGDINIYQSIKEEQKKRIVRKDTKVESQEPQTEEATGNIIPDNIIKETKILDGGSYEGYGISFEKMEAITGEISSDLPINVYIMNSRNFRYFKDDEDYSCKLERENIIDFSFRFAAPRKGDWHLVIENTNDDDDAKVNIKIDAIPNKYELIFPVCVLTSKPKPKCQYLSDSQIYFNVRKGFTFT